MIKISPIKIVKMTFSWAKVLV